MNCIYVAFYKNLKSYDGNAVNKEERLAMLELCVASFRRCNPGIPVIVDKVEEEMANTADMYFDKMTRIKELNYNYNVLWVDADTICLENISDLFSDQMSGAYWGHWDGLNVINGGVIFYPKRFLYDNYDLFVKSWIGLLSSLNEEGAQFIGPHEQVPITDLMLSQIGKNSRTYSIRDNEKKLTKQGLLFDRSYNTNPFTRHYENISVINECNTIYGKKILHLNTSENSEITLSFAKYVSENLIGHTSDPVHLIETCDHLKVSNKFIDIKKTKTTLKVNNNTDGFISLYELSNYTRSINHSVYYTLSPGHFYTVSLDKIKECIIKNLLSGEIKVL